MTTATSPSPVPDTMAGWTLTRYRTADLLPHLPSVRRFRIEINGCLAGCVEAIDEAPRELAVGWAFMHRFIDPAAPPQHLTMTSKCISMMTSGGIDIDRMRLDAAGWSDESPSVPGRGQRRWARSASWSAIDAVTMVERAFHQFAETDQRIGFAHAALVSADRIHCVARDLSTHMAVAKVLGWVVGDDEDSIDTVLVVSGIVEECVIEAAARLQIAVVATDRVPTRNAVRAAERGGVSLLALAMSHRRGLVVDAGHVADDERMCVER